MKIFDSIKKLFIKGSADYDIAANDISGESYRGFVRYALERSDYFTFQMPNFEHYIISEKNRHLVPDEMIEDIESLPSNIKDNEFFIRYNEKTAPLLGIIKEQIVSDSYDMTYLDEIYNYGTKTYIVKISDVESCYGFLTAADSLFSWRADNFPEDICFFRDGKCWLKTVSHEKYAFVDVCDESKEEVKQFGDVFSVFESNIYLPLN